jgi:hypothetical protein
MLWQVISSIASAVAALAAFITAIIMAYQSRLMRQSIGVDALLRLDTHFNSPDMKDVRRKAASFLLWQRFNPHLVLPDTQNKCRIALDDLLDFFEGIAFLSLRKGTPDPESVWCFFFGYIDYYLHAAKEHLQGLVKHPCLRHLSRNLPQCLCPPPCLLNPFRHLQGLL